ncbi:MAG: TonB-dependent receptor [Puia sp.]|nr:TonB-dependent receptor [Puia sp.]
MRKLLLLIAFIIGSFSLYSQTILSGKIVDSKTGSPLSGASVKNRSGRAGTATDNQGFFKIPAKPGDMLEITIIGYTTQTFHVSDQTTITLALEPASTELKEVVFVGNRGAGRAKTETPVPVDVIKVNQVGLSTGKMELTSLLNMSAPSFNYNKQSGGDGADAVDLATLRGLGPDQTLVLINGKRQHQTAFVALFGTRGRGNSGTDLNAIPEASIDRVEILRDGASAQYGSDAIAGVINIILKKDVGHLAMTGGYAGYYDHKFNALKSPDPSQYVTSHKFDGQTGSFGLNYGVAVGRHDGFVNFSANFLAQGKTFRQVPDTNIYSNPKALPINNVRRAMGDASVTSGGIMINSEIPLAGTKTTFYAFGGYNYKNSNAYAYSRNFSGHPERFPTDASGNLIFVPGIMHTIAGGDTYYNPIEDVHITDGSLALGFKGDAGNNWNWDLSNTFGGNNFHYFGDKTFNASLGSQGIHKNHFDDGGFSLIQNTTNLDLSKRYAEVAQGMTLSMGAEFRYEQYSIYKGEEASYTNYGTAAIPYPNGDTTYPATGAQGFPGFQPLDVIKAHRTNIAGYAEADIDITKEWLVDGAVRFENYSDFGFVNTYKLATRYKLTHNFNLRGSVSTGYRAPSLQQINFSNTESNVVAGTPTLVKIAPNYSPITRAAGIPDLKQEKSVNASLGFSWKPAPQWTVTVDGYLVKITNRVVLSGQFQASDASLDPVLTSTLQSLGVNSAQFFANAVNTTNTGIDVVVDYNKRWGKNRFNIVFAGNVQNMTIDKINVPGKLNDSWVHQQTFYSVREQQFLKASAPPEKLGLTAEYDINKFGVGAHLTYFGQIKLQGYGYSGNPALTGTGLPGDPNLEGTGIAPMVNLGPDGSGPLVPEQFVYHGKVVTDLFFSLKFSKKAVLYWGVDNLFNVHPDLGIVPGANGSPFDGETGGPWDAVQMGYDGMRPFVKLALNL